MDVASRRSRVVVVLALVVSLTTACDGGDTMLPGSGPSAREGAIDAIRNGDTLAADVPLRDLCRDRFADVEPDATLRVGLLTNAGRIDDGTFNQYAYEGMRAAADCFGLETTHAAHDGSGDPEPLLRELAAQNLDAIVTVGFPLAEATSNVAGEQPQVAFIGIDQTIDVADDNYARVSFRDDQAGFLAGVVAGMLTETRTVGVVGGPQDVAPVVALADGFEAGVAHVAGDVTILRSHLPSFSDAAAGAKQADEFEAGGADVIYGPAGMTGSGAIRQAAQRGLWAIGVDQDQYLSTFEGGRTTGAERVVTSTVKRVDLAVFLQLADLVHGTFEGGPVELGAAEGGVTYAPVRPATIPSSVHRRLEDIRLELATGRLDATTGEVTRGSDDD